MAPNTSASASDVDNETTAELPVLDVAAYEATLDTAAHTDSWVIPVDADSQPASDVTMQMPMPGAAIPTLRVADDTGTHEMPMLSKARAPKRESASAPAAVPAPAGVSASKAAPPAPSAPAVAATSTRNTYSAPTPVVLPPSPPLIEELRGALATAERRIEELGERARIADAERAVAVARANAESAQLREQLGLHFEALQTARGRLDVQGSDESGLSDEMFARGDRIATLEREFAAQARVLTEKVDQLFAARQRCERLDVDAMNLRASVARRDAQIGILEADLLARQQREQSMSSKLLDALAATDPQMPHLRSEVHARDAEIRRLTLEVGDLKTKLTEREDDLQVAEESLRNLEIDVRDKSAKLSEANVTVEEWRAVIAESQRSILQRDSRIQQLETDLEKRLAAADAAHENEGVALEGPARVLIRTDGNTDFVHVLGRRTRIGRGPDNELVLDTKHISRYHAVLLAGPVHTAIEDLNSTNGVFVNGKRIARQILKDGDRVTIGRSQFRYTVRT